MKMKRIAAAMLATVMAVSLSACGTSNVSTGSEDTGEVQVKTERTDNEKPDSDDSAASAVTDATEQTEQTTTTTAPEEPEVPVELPLMNAEPELIMNGCMAFKCDGKNYVYNITDNELYETEYDVDDITVLSGCVAIFENIWYYGLDAYAQDEYTPYVVNIKTNEKYDDLIPIGYDENYITLGKLEKGFSNDVLTMGMLDNKGEWVLPLSDKYALCEIENIGKVTWTSHTNNIIALAIGSNTHLYDIKTDSVSMLDEATYVWGMTKDNITLGKYNYLERSYSIYNYNADLSDETLVLENLDQQIAYSDYVFDNGNYVYLIDNKVNVYDKCHNHIATYSLSDYVLKNIKSASESVIVFTAKNKSNDLYTIILNKDGNTVCEPVMGDIGMPYFSENKIVFISDDADRIIDISTGEITEYDDSFDIVNYDDVNDLMIVKSGDAYYLADPEAPDTLINPFERAYN